MQIKSPERGRILNVAARRVHCLESGEKNGPPIALLHGCGSLAQEVIEPFRRTHYRIVAPDRPGYGLSCPLPKGRQGPLPQSYWLEDLISTLQFEEAPLLIAHSLASGPALLLAERRPDLISGLMLLGPFCRPTPHKPMLTLRALTAPVIGPVLRRWVMPCLSTITGPSYLRALFSPNTVPDGLRLPFRHAVRGSALPTMAGELRAFNEDMADLNPISDKTRVRVIWGGEDRTAAITWHLPWLRKRCLRLEVYVASGVGHMPHHVAAQLISSMLARDRGALHRSYGI
jgi:pimeloyl-ACP methyl ester carboxylesterase